VTANVAIRVEGLSRLVKNLVAFGEVSMPAEIATANRAASETVATVVRGALPTGKTSQGDRHPGAWRSSVQAKATAIRGRVQVGNGIDYSKPQLYGHRGRDKHRIDAVEEGVKAVEPQVRSDYEAAISRALGIFDA
jgi:hypothetical protein